MTEQLTAIEKNCTTGEEIIRPLTEQELVDYQKNIDDFNAKEVIRLAEVEALATLKASAKAKLVAGEPLTAEEADTLVI
jgi:hypothetical protein